MFPMLCVTLYSRELQGLHKQQIQKRSCLLCGTHRKSLFGFKLYRYTMKEIR